MNIKKALKKLYPINEYKQLKKENPLGFYLTILIPLLLLSFFLYLYFYPFGYSREYTFSNEEISDTTSGNTYFSNLEDEQDGLTYITFNPKLPVRNPNIKLSVKGEDIYVLPIKERMTELKDIWEYTTTNFKREILDSEVEYTGQQYGEYTYGYVEDYIPKELGIYTVYMKYMPEITIDENISEPEEQEFYPKEQQLLFKYKNMRVIQLDRKYTE